MESSDKMYCDHCDKEDDILLSTSKRRTLEGELYWVCGECFSELEGVSFDAFGREVGYEA